MELCEAIIRDGLGSDFRAHGTKELRVVDTSVYLTVHTGRRFARPV